MKKEVENMKDTNIIYPIDQLERANPIVIQPKKHDTKRLRICDEFRRLNMVTLTDPFPTLFGDEIIIEVVGHECYSFTNGFYAYNKIPIDK